MERYELIDHYLAGLAGRLGRGRGARDAVDEIRDHLQLTTDDLVARGCTTRDAQFQALDRLGPADPLARGIRRQLVGRASWLTRAAGMFGMLAGLSLIVGLAPLFYLLVIPTPGARPNAALAITVTTGLGQLFVIPFLAGLVSRAARQPYRLPLVAAAVAMTVLSIGGFGPLMFADAMDKHVGAVLLPLLQVAVLVPALRPWSTDGVGPRWARVAICIAILIPGMLMLAEAAYAFAIAAGVILLAPTSICLGQQLWAERPGSLMKAA